MSDIATTEKQRVDAFQRQLEQLPKEQILNIPVAHRFTPHMYIREVYMPKGSTVVSHTHKTEHPYVVSKGKVSVYLEGGEVATIEAPYTGITKAGTRRILHMHEDTVWTTFHVTEETDVEKLENLLVDKLPPLQITKGEQ